MKNSVVLIFLILLVAGAFYFIGKKSGSANAKITMVENVDMIKLIAELGALDVSGSINLKISNKGEEEGSWDKLKNFLGENTLQVSLPYDAKFGVNLTNQKMNVDTKAGKAIIYLPHCKLISLQLKLDRMETMTQTGIFSRSSMDDLVKAQKELYAQTLANVQNNPKYIKLAEDHIATVLNNYYKPLGHEVKCVFGEQSSSQP
jgi:hypothetical protein